MAGDYVESTEEKSASVDVAAEEATASVTAVEVVEFNGLSVPVTDVFSRIDAGDIDGAESVILDGLSINPEEAKAILGRLEFQRGNIESALRLFESIDLQAAVQRLQTSVLEKPSSKRGRSRTESLHGFPQQNVSVIIEAIHFKSISLHKLGRGIEGAQECKSVLDTVEKIFPNGIAEALVDNQLLEAVVKAVELLPELWKHAGNDQETMISYRRALLSNWRLDEECCARIQKRFAEFLLYSSVEAGEPSYSLQPDGLFVPKNNLEEAILLLLILLRKSNLGNIQWDPFVMEHLTFALSICNQTAVLARQFEEILPGVYHRCDRWYSLALSYSGAGQKNVALNLLRKCLGKHENPNDVLTLLLASKICSEDSVLALEGIEYARRAIENIQVDNEHLKSIGLHILGICLAKQAKLAPSDQERSLLQVEALKILEDAIGLERNNPDLLFDLGFIHAQQNNANSALRYAKDFIDSTGGSILKGWGLLALVLSAQQRYSEAEAVIDAALDETSKWEKGLLLRIKSKLKATQSRPMDAVESYGLLLALVQAQRKVLESSTGVYQAEDDKDGEFQVWQGLANLYSSLSYWKDAEICLQKARALKPFSGALLHTEGVMYQEQGNLHEAMAAYSDALYMEVSHVPCKVSLGSLLWRRGSKSLAAARSFLSDALRIEPTNRMAWHYLGMVHRDDDRKFEAADCFQAASMLEESDPVESFASIC